MKKTALFLLLVMATMGRAQENKPYTRTLVSKIGTDTISVETYNIIGNHLYGKSFVRQPVDHIREFSYHFYPDGSIREHVVKSFEPLQSSVPKANPEISLPYIVSLNCKDGDCTYYSSGNDHVEDIVVQETEYLDFIGGWVPNMSNIEWLCMRLAKSGKKHIPLRMSNSEIGFFDIGVQRLAEDTIIFGGPFIKYGKAIIDNEGRFKYYDGSGTPWNYIVTKHPPMDIDQVAKRLSKTKNIGIASPTETHSYTIKDNKITLTYGRPARRGRVIFGGIVPYDSIWRTGANWHTTLTLEKGITLGENVLPKGKYSIYTVPGRDEWKLIFNTDFTRWPTDPDRSKDLVTVVLPVEKPGSEKERLTIEFIETKKGGRITIAWDDAVAWVNFKINKN